MRWRNFYLFIMTGACPWGAPVFLKPSVQQWNGLPGINFTLATLSLLLQKHAKVSCLYFLTAAHTSAFP